MFACSSLDRLSMGLIPSLRQKGKKSPLGTPAMREAKLQKMLF